MFAVLAAVEFFRVNAAVDVPKAPELFKVVPSKVRAEPVANALVELA